MFYECTERIYQCKDCENIGEPVDCKKCAGGKGWPCKADKNGQHIHPQMRQCTDFKIKLDLTYPERENDAPKHLDKETMQMTTTFRRKTKKNR